MFDASVPLPGATISFDQLIAATTVVHCERCGLKHAPVRSCMEG